MATTALVVFLLILMLAAIGALVVPVNECPKCRGRGLHRMLDPQGPPQVRGVVFEPVPCDYCSNRKSVSFFKSWRWHSEDGPVAPVYRD